MTYLIAALVGALIGWLASMIMNTDTQQGAIANVFIGIVGATLGRWLFADQLGLGGAAAAGDFSLGGLFWGVVGAVILIAALKVSGLMRGQGSHESVM
jgi:uncharacterized membrane protein YeaQ/YmgE (transglycosylase-associated protein family)